MTAIAKISYTHDAMIDLIIATPGVSQRALAANFGYTEGWVSQVMASDAFKSRLAERKGQLVDPTITASMEERIEGMARLSMERIREAMENNPGKVDVALKAFELSSRSLGYGAKDTSIGVQNNYIVQLPAKEKDGKEWEKAYSPQVIDAVPVTQREGA